ncbi:unnamed protein product [Xylocopa violacea]|uniref:Transcription factor Adf-1 n=1 Tax=Xylocopa violacea TaxID=135666 RepID=A0ABP1NUF8_XYLVO
MSELRSFVQIIQKYPCLYNHTLTDYLRKDITDEAWNQVAKETKWSVADCKEKWRNVRNGFVRSLKIAARRPSARRRRLYHLYDVMQFILPYIKLPNDIEHFGNLLSPSNNDVTLQEVEEQDEIDISQESRSSHEEARYQQESKDCTDDYRKMFLLSLLPDVRKLSDTEMREFKLKVLMLLSKIPTQP